MSETMPVVASDQIAALVKCERAAALKEREAEAQAQVARWMLTNSLATGHGDTMADLLGEASWQVSELRERAETAEAEVARLREALTPVPYLTMRGRHYRRTRIKRAGDGM